MRDDHLLELRDVSSVVNNEIVVNHVDLKIETSEVAVLVGSNGEGKAALLKVIAGHIPILSGAIYLNQRIHKPGCVDSVRKGIVYVPQGPKIIHELNVEENLELGAYSKKADMKKQKEYVYSKFPVLYSIRKEKPNKLLAWQQQFLTIARGFMASPKILLLHDPYYGLMPNQVDELLTTLIQINQESRIALLFAVQSLHSLLNNVNHVYVFEQGRISKRGTAQEIFTAQFQEG